MQSPEMDVGSEYFSGWGGGGKSPLEIFNVKQAHSGEGLAAIYKDVLKKGYHYSHTLVDT